jgi:two-component system, sensor histidine kinase RpfC
MSALADRWRAAAAKAWRGRAPAADFGEQGITLARLVLASLVLFAGGLEAFSGAEARRFVAKGLPGLQAYLAVVGVVEAHFLIWPERRFWRRILGICGDAAIITYGLYIGSGASAFLYPLYLWMILGNGLRLGAVYMAAAVVSAATGFAAVIRLTPFWRHNTALSAGLFLALVTMPAYGALLLRRVAVARAEAERANRAKTLLLANVSHELRTPLTAILGLGDLLTTTRLDDGQRKMVKTIRGAGGILLRHIEGLLTVSRDEIAAKAPPVETVDLYALMVSLRDMLAVEADRKGIRLGLSMDVGAPRFIRAESGLLLDTIQNLGGNAVKFTDRGAVALHVLAKDAGGGLLLRIEARDTGIGIDKAAQDRIFETFVQGGPDIAARFGGSGLGLAIARRRIEARGGRIGVESEPGRGAVFWFELMVERAARAASASADSARDVAPPLCFDGAQAWGGPWDAPQAPGPVCVVASAPFDALALARRFALAAVARRDRPEEIAAARSIAAQLDELAGGLAAAAGDAAEEKVQPRGMGRKILLAEDNGVNRMIFAAILSGAGYEVTPVGDGEAALDAMLSEDFDLFLLDLNMPKIDGVEAARLYRLARAGVSRAPIVALTADAGAARREECEQAGMAACLVKPIAAEALLDALDAAQQQRAKKWKPVFRKNAAETKESGADGAAAVFAPPCRRATEKGAPPDLDPKSIDALAALGGEDFLRQVVREFIDEGGRIAERMIVAVGRADLHAFGREAHALESSAGNVGAAALARLCRTWRALGQEAFALSGDDCLDDLRQVWRRTAVALDAAVASRGATPGRDEAA